MERCKTILKFANVLFKIHQVNNLPLSLKSLFERDRVYNFMQIRASITVPPISNEFAQPLKSSKDEDPTISQPPPTSENKTQEGPGETSEQNLLKDHLPPIDIDMDADSDASDNEFHPGYETEDENEKRAGAYHSKGISVYVPEKCMTPGTKRHRIKYLPKDMFDDIRVIFFK